MDAAVTSRAALALLVVATAGCKVDELDLTGRACPCVSGWRCDDTSNTCVRDPVIDGPWDGDGPIQFDAQVDASSADARVDAVPGTTCIGPHGTNLFTDDFTDLIGWASQQGTWAAAGSEAVQSNTATAVAYAHPVGLAIADYRIAARMRQLTGAGTDAMKIAFRIETGGDGQYQCGWAPNTGRLDLVWIRSNGMVGGTLQATTVDIGAIAGYDPADAVTMEVLAQGNGFTCCLLEYAGATVSATDTRYATGSPGLGTASMSAAFDDFRVDEP
jgi:hypothetical protein